MKTIRAIFDAAIVVAITGLCLFATIGCAGRHIDNQFRDSLNSGERLGVSHPCKSPDFD